MALYKISLVEQNKLIEELSKRHDAKSERIKRYLAMPDLSRTSGSPLSEIVKRVTNLPALLDFDDIDIPEIISTDIIFDLFNFPADHPARTDRAGPLRRALSHARGGRVFA